MATELLKSEASQMLMMRKEEATLQVESWPDVDPRWSKWLVRRCCTLLERRPKRSKKSKRKWRGQTACNWNMLPRFCFVHVCSGFTPLGVFLPGLADWDFTAQYAADLEEPVNGVRHYSIILHICWDLFGIDRKIE